MIMTDNYFGILTSSTYELEIGKKLSDFSGYTYFIEADLITGNILECTPTKACKS